MALPLMEDWLTCRTGDFSSFFVFGFQEIKEKLAAKGTLCTCYQMLWILFFWDRLNQFSSSPGALLRNYSANLSKCGKKYQKLLFHSISALFPRKISVLSHGGEKIDNWHKRSLQNYLKRIWIILQRE